MTEEASKNYTKAFLRIPGKLEDDNHLGNLSMESTVLLSSGHRMPVIGLGTSLVTDEEAVQVALTRAIEVGYRHIDTAFGYQNEKMIGSTVKKLIESGKVKREELFIVDKLPFNGMNPESVEYFCMKSVAALQLDYIDLYLIHSPIATKRTNDDNEIMPLRDGIVSTENVDFVKTWQAMESLVRKGLVKSIGLSNFNSVQIQRVYDAALIKPSNLQVECHAYLPQYELFNFCKQLNIAFTAYCPLGCPHFPGFARDTLGLDYSAPKLLEEEKVKYLANHYNKTPAQVLLRFLVQRGIIVIPRSINPQRIQENIEIFDFYLNEEDMNLMKSLENGFRYIKMDFWKGMKEHPEYPFNIPM